MKPEDSFTEFLKSIVADAASLSSLQGEAQHEVEKNIKLRCDRLVQLVGTMEECVVAAHDWYCSSMDESVFKRLHSGDDPEHIIQKAYKKLVNFHEEQNSNSK
jgi:hypothetical protein